MLNIFITTSQLNKNGQGFDVKFRGEVILKNSRNPEPAALLELADRGFHGDVMSYMNGVPSLKMHVKGPQVGVAEANI